LVESHVAEPEVGHHEALQHHFANMEQQREASTIGMWVFLVTEIMFFGGMFLAYTIYRGKYPESFAVASNHLDIWLGGVNTVILICSSFTMALAVYCTQVGKLRLQIIFLIMTMIFGAAFLGIKAVEYHEKYVDNLIPGQLIPGHKFNPTVNPHGAPHDPHKLELIPNSSVRQVELFYWIYFAMTGMHALHMIIGLGIMSFLLYFSIRGRYGPEYHNPIEITGLYWHFVDIIWIFLFPLLYLLGRHMAGHG
jgi:cytochrome c oxidase subunit 3